MSDNKYDQRNIDTMEMIYGEGFLSPGGAEEVARIMQGLDLGKARILDVGCGLGGAAIAMAGDLGASDVVGVDIDAGLLERAQVLVTKAGLGGQVELQLVSPGPLPFDDASFDIAYVNSVSCHMADLTGFFKQIHRVTKSSGLIVGSEWYRASNPQAFARWDNTLRERGLNFWFVTQVEFEGALGAAGYSDVSFVDRTADFTIFANEALARVHGELQEALTKTLGEPDWQAFEAWTAARAAGLGEGGIDHGHFRARHSQGG